MSSSQLLQTITRTTTSMPTPLLQDRRQHRIQQIPAASIATTGLVRILLEAKATGETSTPKTVWSGKTNRQHQTPRYGPKEVPNHLPQERRSVETMLSRYLQIASHRR